MQLPPDTNAAGPFAALSLIVAPAILTNVTSLLVTSTSTRLARAVDQGRELARELEANVAGSHAPETTRRLRELASADRRSILLLRALRAVYAAMAGFATATLLSLVGVVLARALGEGDGMLALELLALSAGVVGVGGVLWAATLLVRETRIAVGTMHERIRAQQARFPAVAEAVAGAEAAAADGGHARG